MAEVKTGFDDVDRLMKMARRMEREGKLETAEVIYTAASEIARMRDILSADEHLLEAAIIAELDYTNPYKGDVAINILAALRATAGRGGQP